MINNLKRNTEIKNGDYEIFRNQVEKFEAIEAKEKINNYIKSVFIKQKIKNKFLIK